MLTASKAKLAGGGESMEFQPGTHLKGGRKGRAILGRLKSPGASRAEKIVPKKGGEAISHKRSRKGRSTQRREEVLPQKRGECKSNLGAQAHPEINTEGIFETTRMPWSRGLRGRVRARNKRKSFTNGEAVIANGRFHINREGNGMGD